MPHPKVAMLGLGRMGTAIAERFLAGDVPLAVWNRTPSKAFPFDGRARIGETAAVACADSEIITLSLSDYGAGLEVIDQVAGDTDLAGKTLVQLSSGSASDARTMHAWASMHGLQYLDASIVAYPHTVGSESTVVFYAGDETVWERCAETMRLIGGMSRYVGDAVGAAATLNCAVLEFYYGATLSMLHGAALCNSEGMSLNEYFYIVKALAPELAATADSARPMIAKERYKGSRGALSGHVAALRHVQRMSHDNEVDTRLPDAIMSAYKKAVAAGYGDDEIAALFETLKHGR